MLKPTLDSFNGYILETKITIYDHYRDFILHIHGFPKPYIVWSVMFNVASNLEPRQILMPWIFEGVLHLEMNLPTSKIVTFVY